MDALLFQPEIADHTEERATADGFRTRVLVRPAGSEEGIDERALQLASDVSLKYLRVDVVWQDGVGAKSYALESLRVAPTDDE
jgi:hypothetical protein